MAKFKVSELPKKEKTAHNMIRVPAWVFGGLWTFSGLISLLVFALVKLVETMDPSEFEEMPDFFSQIMPLMSWSVFLSLGLGVIYLIIGFTYRRFIRNGKPIMIGVALVTLFSFILLMMSAFDFQAGIMEYVGEDLYMEDFDTNVFLQFNRFGMILGFGISIIYHLVPAILGYIGFHKLNVLNAEKAE